jgi:hypothetical protein
MLSSAEPQVASPRTWLGDGRSGYRVTASNHRGRGHLPKVRRGSCEFHGHQVPAAGIRLYRADTTFNLFLRARIHEDQCLSGTNCRTDQSSAPARKKYGCWGQGQKRTMSICDPGLGLLKEWLPVSSVTVNKHGHFDTHPLAPSRNSNIARTATCGPRRNFALASNAWHILSLACSHPPLSSSFARLSENLT